MTMEEMCKNLQNECCTVQVGLDNWYKSSGDDTPWKVTIQKEAHGMQLKVEETNEDIEVAMLGAYKKFRRAITNGLPELTPAIEHKKNEINDEIPF